MPGRLFAEVIEDHDDLVRRQLAVGLGRLIQEHLVARDYAAVLGAICGLVVLTVVIDAASNRLRSALR